METDERTYIKVHDGIEDHPKVAPLSDKAFRLLITTWGWCSRHLTDGLVPLSVWNRRGNKRSRNELVDAKLVEVRDQHVLMHDYPKHQRTAAEVDEKREAKRRGARLGNHRRWHVDQGKRDINCELCLIGLPSDSDRTTDAPLIDSGSLVDIAPLSTEVEVEVHKEKETSSTAPRSKGDDPDFVKFWEAYPRKVGKGEARKVWARIIKSGVDPSLIIAGAQRYRDDTLRRRKDLSYTKHPGPWLNAERWTDQLNGNDLHPATTAWWDN